MKKAALWKLRWTKVNPSKNEKIYFVLPISSSEYFFPPSCLSSMGRSESLQMILWILAFSINANGMTKMINQMERRSVRKKKIFVYQLVQKILFSTNFVFSDPRSKTWNPWTWPKSFTNKMDFLKKIIIKRLIKIRSC